MTRKEFQSLITSMNKEQWDAVRVCIMAERKLRTSYPRDPASKPVLEEAYEWALNNFNNEIMIDRK